MTKLPLGATKSVLSIELFTDNIDLIDKARALNWEVAIGLRKHNQGMLHLLRFIESPHIKPAYDELYTLYDKLTADLSNDELLAFVPNLNNMAPKGSSRSRLLGGMIAIDAGIQGPGIDFFSSYTERDKLPVELQKDKYGLVVIDDRFQLEDQGIIFNNVLLFYHPFLRRFFNSRFVDTPAILRHLNKSAKVELKIALDPIIHATPNMLDRTIELDYWHGQHFDASRLNNRNFTGVTVHGRNDPTGLLDFTFPITKTVFYIKDYSNGEKEFQIEEIVPIGSRTSSGKSYVLHRFAHFIWNIDKQVFNHIDCSVLIYTKDEHEKRTKYDWKLNDTTKYANVYDRKKLFRLDGEMELEIIKDLLFSFFRYNELVMEYFGSSMTDPLTEIA